MTADTDLRAEKVALAECPIGLFWKGGELCLKTEYGNNEGRIDAYIVSSGEFFWGDQPQTIANQRRNMVVPIDTDEAIATLSILDNETKATRSDEALVAALTEIRDLNGSNYESDRAWALGLQFRAKLALERHAALNPPGAE